MRSDEALIEFQQTSLAYQLALARLGAESIVELLALWRRVKPDDLAATAQSFLDDAITMVLSRRRISQDLAIAYYRLARALRTGKTIPDPDDPTPRWVTLDHLRDQFNALAYPDGEIPDEVADFDHEVHEPVEEPELDDEDVDGEKIPDSAQPTRDVLDQEAPDEINEDRIEIVDEWSGVKDPEISDLEDLLEELDAQDDFAEEAVREHLKEVLEDLKADEQAINERAEKAKKRDDERRQEQAERAREKSREAARTRAKGIVHRVVANGGRGAQEYIVRRDRNVIGYVRVSKTGTPCYFCAAMISRGVVYKSLIAAGGSYDKPNRWHDNCNCFAVPIFFWGDYRDSSMFDMNRYMWEQWKKMKGSLDEWVGPREKRSLMNAWRRYYAANS